MCVVYVCRILTFTYGPVTSSASLSWGADAAPPPAAFLFLSFFFPLLAPPVDANSTLARGDGRPA